MRKKSLLKSLPVLAALLFLGAEGRGAIISNVAVEAVSSQYSNNGNDQRIATNLVNGCGLFGANHTYNITGSGWLTSDTTPGAYSNAFVVFDLGAVHKLSRIKIYNYDEGTPSATGSSNGVQRADFLFGTEDGTYDITNAGVFLNKAPGGSSTVPNFVDFSQYIDLAGISARYVRINVITNWGGGTIATNVNKVGLCKVLFIDTNVQASVTLATKNFASNSITVWFSEPVSPATATNVANYSIAGSGADSPSILGTSMGPLNDNVTLTTSSLTNIASAYTLNVTNVAVVSDGTLITNSVLLQSQVAFWLKADAGVVTNGDGTVTNWLDQSGNGNDAIQTNSAAQPTFVASDVNGLPSIQFGTSHYIDIPYSPTMSLQRDYSIVAVVKTTSAGNNEILSRAVGNRAAPFDYRLTSSAVVLYRGNQGGNGAYSSATGKANSGVGTASLVSGVISGTNCIHYLNGLLNGNGIVLIGFNDAQGATRIAGRADNGVWLSGTISEIMLFRGALTASDQSALNKYVADKYALPITDLIFQQQPQNATAYEGQTVTFNASAIASSTALITYQWRTNGVNIPGATNATYTTPTLTLADNGVVYTVVVASLGENVTSSPATLTVQVDNIPPTVSYAGSELWSGSNIVVVFSEPVDPNSATNLANYAIDNGATIVSATFGDSPNKVILTVAGMSSGVSYQLTVQGVQDLFGNTMASIQVSNGVYPSLSLWLKADAGVTADESGLVSEWDDQSGNVNHSFQPGGSLYEPLLVPGDFNGQPALRFDGVNSYLVALPSSSLAITGDMAIYAVVQFADYSSTAGNEIVGKTAGTANNIPAPYDFYAGPGTGRVRFYRGNGGSAGSGISFANVTGVNAPSTTAPHIVAANMMGTTASQYLDGATNGVSEINISIADGGGPLGIGARSDFGSAGSPMLKGDLAELMIFSVALSDADRAALDNYLGGKYGIAIGSGPSPTLSISLLPGGNLTLSWPTPTANYVLKSAANLSGATWATVTNSVNSANGTNSVTLQATGSSQFFRLQKQ